MSTCVYNRMYCVLPVARVVQLYYSNTTAVESYSYSRQNERENELILSAIWAKVLAPTVGVCKGRRRPMPSFVGGCGPCVRRKATRPRWFVRGTSVSTRRPPSPSWPSWRENHGRQPDVPWRDGGEHGRKPPFLRI